MHLEYQFAGTTGRVTQVRNAGLYADISRIRGGDRVYFYLNNKGYYGPFKADPDEVGVWWDKIYPTYLQERLEKRLIYRIRVVEDGAYPTGVSEWEALDRHLREPERCLWSLVYRKLKGARGCTMIFPWEDDFLLQLITETNASAGKHPINHNPDQHLTWNAGSEEIVVVPGLFPKYAPPVPDHMSAPEDPANKVRAQAGTEVHLQAFLMRNYGRMLDSDVVFGDADTITWVGNEVACGLGMQKIDILSINDTEGGRLFRVIELKKDPPGQDIVRQLSRYIDWMDQFIPGTNAQNIQPVLLCRNLAQIQLGVAARDSFHRFNEEGWGLPLKYIECVIDSGDIRFREVPYD